MMVLENVWKNMFEGGSLWAGVITGGLSQIQDTLALTNGKLKAEDYAVNSTKNVSVALGTMAGVECGAIIGTAIMPGFGTVLGSIFGGLVGDKFGTTVGVQAGHLMFKSSSEKSPATPLELPVPNPM